MPTIHVIKQSTSKEVIVFDSNMKVTSNLEAEAILENEASRESFDEADEESEPSRGEEEHGVGAPTEALEYTYPDMEKSEPLLYEGDEKSVASTKAEDSTVAAATVDTETSQSVGLNTIMASISALYPSTLSFASTFTSQQEGEQPLTLERTRQLDSYEGPNSTTDARDDTSYTIAETISYDESVEVSTMMSRHRGVKTLHTSAAASLRRLKMPTMGLRHRRKNSSSSFATKDVIQEDESTAANGIPDVLPMSSHKMRRGLQTIGLARSSKKALASSKHLLGLRKSSMSSSRGRSPSRLDLSPSQDDPTITTSSTKRSISVALGLRSKSRGRSKSPSSLSRKKKKRSSSMFGRRKNRSNQNMQSDETIMEETTPEQTENLFTTDAGNEQKSSCNVKDLLLAFDISNGLLSLCTLVDVNPCGIWNINEEDDFKEAVTTAVVGSAKQKEKQSTSEKMESIVVAEPEDEEEKAVTVERGQDKVKNENTEASTAEARDDVDEDVEEVIQPVNNNDESRQSDGNDEQRESVEDDDAEEREASITSFGVVVNPYWKGQEDEATFLKPTDEDGKKKDHELSALSNGDLTQPNNEDKQEGFGDDIGDNELREDVEETIEERESLLESGSDVGSFEQQEEEDDPTFSKSMDKDNKMADTPPKPETKEEFIITKKSITRRIYGDGMSTFVEQTVAPQE